MIDICVGDVKVSNLYTHFLHCDAQWRSGAVAQWRSGAVAQWRSGAVAQWRSGAVA